MKPTVTHAATQPYEIEPTPRVFTLDHYVRFKLITRPQEELLRVAIARRQNILVGGEGEAGATTFLNALLSVIAESDDRVVVLQVSPELVCTSARKLEICVRPPVTWKRAVTTARRFRREWLVVDDCYDDIFARELMTAWRETGGGIGTMCGANSQEMLEIASDRGRSGSVTDARRALTARTFQFCVHLQRDRRGRRSISVERVLGFRPGRGFQLEPLGAE